MKFIRRLLYYFIGVGLGMLLVYFFFGKEKTNNAFFGWLPENAVKNALQKNTITFSDRYQDCLNICLKKDSNLIKNWISEGDVIFKESDTRVYPKKYAIKIENNTLFFLQKDSIYETELVEINGKLTCCDKND